ncbi:hypothetical protein BDV95DRAFT_152353 [Massariosphaeria phaeospora]|uniref:Uncharacterized protein n=1 Tax=Massariosphaeria phaeospora TaxID=100035 RepID=A0A7C8MN83_9PLEO|nr:hypothetical protein BDV95DRAFT_152353 [Massariosphaeria phaeospora]
MGVTHLHPTPPPLHHSYRSSTIPILPKLLFCLQCPCPKLLFCRQYPCPSHCSGIPILYCTTDKMARKSFRQVARENNYQIPEGPWDNYTPVPWREQAAAYNEHRARVKAARAREERRRRAQHPASESSNSSLSRLIARFRRLRQSKKTAPAPPPRRTR